MHFVYLSESEEQKFERHLITEQNAKIWRRLQAVYSRGQGISCQEIARNLSVSLNTVTTWVKMYLSEGIESLITLNYIGPVSKLEPYKQDIENILKTQKIPTLLDLQQKVQEEFGVEIGETGLYKWCKKKLMLPLRRQE